MKMTHLPFHLLTERLAQHFSALCMRQKGVLMLTALGFCLSVLLSASSVIF